MKTELEVNSNSIFDLGYLFTLRIDGIIEICRI